MSVVSDSRLNALAGFSSRRLRPTTTFLFHQDYGSIHCTETASLDDRYEIELYMQPTHVQIQQVQAATTSSSLAPAWHLHYNMRSCNMQMLHGVATAAASAVAVCRRREVLTVQPASEATGPSFLLMDPPALNKAMSTPLKLQWHPAITRCASHAAWSFVQRIGKCCSLAYASGHR